MGRKSLKEVRQKEIVLAFYEVSKREGLENASIAKVAKEMGVNPSLIIHYFTSKDELIFGLISFILESYKLIYLAEDEDIDSKSKLINVVDNLFSKKWDTLFDDGVFYSCFSLIFRNAKIKAAYRELHEHLRKLLTDVIAEAKNEGSVDVENPAEAADLIFVIVEGAYYYLSFYEDGEEYNRKVENYKRSAFDVLNLKVA